MWDVSQDLKRNHDMNNNITNIRIYPTNIIFLNAMQNLILLVYFTIIIVVWSTVYTVYMVSEMTKESVRVIGIGVGYKKRIGSTKIIYRLPF